MTCTSQGNESRTEGKNMEELFLPAPSQWNVYNIQEIYNYRKSTPPQEMISSRSYLTNHPHQKIQNGNRQREKEISSYKRAFIWSEVSVSVSLTQPSACPLMCFDRGESLSWLKGSIHMGRFSGSRAEREGPITRTSTVWNSGLMSHLTLSNTGHSIQCHLYSRTGKKITSKIKLHAEEPVSHNNS